MMLPAYELSTQLSCEREVDHEKYRWPKCVRVCVHLCMCGVFYWGSNSQGDKQVPEGEEGPPLEKTRW